MSVPRVYIAATHQNNGKTTLSLGLLGLLRSRQLRMGYMKPVGQRTVAAEGLQVDEDALLMEKVFSTGAALADMSPVTVGQGFTSEYILRGQSNELEKRIIESFERISAGRDFVVIEGTGHAGVGSVFNLSNARVAKILEAPVIMVAPGGLGRPIDEVTLNRALLDKEGVDLAGVVINKVQLTKYEHVRKLVSRGFERLGVRVIGVLPYDEVLSAPTIGEVLEETGSELVSESGDEEHLGRPVKNYLVGAMSTHQALDYFSPGSLVIIPSDREDVILAAIGVTLTDKKRNLETVAGIILTGKSMPHPAIQDLIRHSRVPIMSCPKDTFSVASQVHDLMAKIRPTDTAKIEHATRLVSQYIDFQKIQDSVGG
jgi:BioD-like phosphotransacetylase family protein